MIRDAARELLEKRLNRKGRPLRLLGVGLSNFVHPKDEAGDLFSYDTHAKETRVDHIMDELQDRFGTDAIHRGRGRLKKK